MIEFSGEYSDESKNYIVTKTAKQLFLSFLITSVIFAVIILFIAIKYDFWIITLFLLALLISNISVLIIPYMKGERVKTITYGLPKSIKINNDGIIEIFWINRNMIKSINDVKKILDLGENYYIIFNFPKGSDILCQKDLIVKGSIEEFEKIFEGKIERKNI